MRQLLKSKQKLLISVTYIALVSVMCITILLIVLRIQSQYAGALINLRFNFYEGITFIGSPDNVWQYLIYAFLFSILNGLAILYIQKKFTKPEVQATIVYWIFGSSILSIGLLVIYLWLILSINS
jgi:hypothetical protein